MKDMKDGFVPKRMTKEEAHEAGKDLKRMAQIRRGDCTFYNACLTQAVDGKWAGFSCEGCASYGESDQFQREMDVVRLRVIQQVAESMHESGVLGRKRGVKEGADAKRTLKVAAGE